LKKNLISFLKIVIPLGIGIFVFWYFYNEMTEEEKTKTWSALKRADYTWVMLSIVFAWLSHFSRAMRWKYLLEPLGCKPKLWNSYDSVMIGYLINMAIPRAGEPARAGYLARYENVTFEKSFGTIFAERVVDTIMLAIVFGVTIILQANNLDKFNEATKTSGGSGTSIWVYAAIGAGVMLVVGIIAFKNAKFKAKILSIIKGFIEGLKTIITMKNKWAFIGHTVFIWVMYLAMFWVCLLALPETSDVGIAAVFASFIAGTLAVVAIQGGIGLYPIMVAGVLFIYGIDEGDGYAVGSIMWASQTVLVIILGLVSLILMPIRNQNNTNAETGSTATEDSLT
jgi:uncharacterized membrane protein YbhN (UPF0104 family)